MRLLFCLSLIAYVCSLSAQSYRSRIHYRVELGDTTQTHQLVLLDYSKLIGLAKEVRRDTLVFRLHGAGEDSFIPANDIRFLGLFGQERRSSAYQTKTPGFTDMTYERTALPYHGRGQYRTIMLLYHVAEFNLNEHLQLGAGLAGPLGVLLTQRVRTSITPNLHVGISNQFLWPPIVQAFTEEFIYVGDLTGIITLGTGDRFLNLGGGIFYASDAADRTVWLSRMGIGGRIGSRWHAYAEAIVSQQARLRHLELYPSVSAAYGNRRHRFQFGMFSILLDQETFTPPPLPFVGYALYW